MKVLNLCVHVASAIVLIGNGALLLLAGLLTSGAALMFDANSSGLILTFCAALLIGVGAATIRFAVGNANLIESDKVAYQASELRLAFWAVALSSAALFMLLLFNSFSVADVFSYGFGAFFVVLSAVIVCNLVAYVLTMIVVR